MDKKIRVLLVEDETIVAEAIHTLLDMEDDISVVGEAGNAEEGVRKARLLKPDVILLDLRLPDRPGVQVIEEVLQKDPDIRIIVLTAYVDDHEVSAAFRAGAIGYLLKTQAISQLVQGIRNACTGQYSLHPAVANIMLRQLNQSHERPTVEKPLSEAEKQVLVCVAKAFTNKEIARELGISHTTVRSHVNRIMTKLHVSNRTQAALYALKQGLATLERPGASRA